VIDVVMDRKRVVRVRSVNAARRGIHQVLHTIVSARLQDVDETDDVRIDVSVRILQRVPNARLSGEVNDDIKFFAAAKLHQAVALGEVSL